MILQSGYGHMIACRDQAVKTVESPTNFGWREGGGIHAWVVGGKGVREDRIIEFSFGKNCGEVTLDVSRWNMAS
ncbi:hypothetical protein JTE90_018859 [Oedothorax gibbosus]|uniref:Uncharacterized protein n=1 Tax=Oedothorax gibbosus TaxID=931172 RepID=A0AAV6TVB0_9ARAC|nr:hypothetical protein JTE90_018859 [Oedothorax gibbosus]